MYRCIIIDDEYYARQRVKRCVDWAALGFKVAAEASSAERALEELERQAAHLAVVDITMPEGSSGLDFIGEALGRWPGMVFIVLSGYSEFEYARQAMRYGVESYLTKPVNSAEMQEAVLRARQTLLNHEDETSGAFWRGFFHTGQAPEEQVAERLARCGIQPDHHYVTVMADVAAKAGLSLAEKQIRNQWALPGLSGRLAANLSGTDTFGHAILVLETERAGEEALAAAFEAANVRREGDNQIGYSLRQPGTPAGLLAGYRQAELAFLSKVLHPTGSRLLRFRPHPGDTAPLAPLYQRVERCLQTHDPNGLRQGMAALFGAITAADLDIQSLEAVLSRLLSAAKAIAAQRRMEEYEMEADLILLSCRELIAHCDSLEEVRARLETLLLPIASADGGGGHTAAVLAQKATGVMEDNFRRSDFGLEMLAALLVVNPSYLSTQFKKHTGVPVSRQITRLRMEEAARILAGEEASVQEVAERVGYNDVFYFSKSFKKYHGLTPTAYRNAQAR